MKDSFAEAIEEDKNEESQQTISEGMDFLDMSDEFEMDEKDEEKFKKIEPPPKKFKWDWKNAMSDTYYLHREEIYSCFREEIERRRKMAAEEKMLKDKKFQEEAKTRSKEMNELLRTAMILEEQRNACWDATKKLKRRLQPF